MLKSINIGKIVRPFNVDGSLKVQLYTDIPATRFAIGNEITITNQKHQSQHVINSYKLHQNHAIITLQGYKTREDVTSLIGGVVSLIIDLAKEDRLAFFDLLDCDVFEQDHHIGRVIEVIDNPAHPILRVARPHQKDALIPFVDVFIVDVDKTKKKIMIQSIEGLL